MCWWRCSARRNRMRCIFSASRKSADSMWSTTSRTASPKCRAASRCRPRTTWTATPARAKAKVTATAATAASAARWSISPSTSTNSPSRAKSTRSSAAPRSCAGACKPCAGGAKTTRCLSARPGSAKPRWPRAWRATSCAAKCRRCWLTARFTRWTWACCWPGRNTAATSSSG